MYTNLRQKAPSLEETIEFENKLFNCKSKNELAILAKFKFSNGQTFLMNSILHINRCNHKIKLYLLSLSELTHPNITDLKGNTFQDYLDFLKTWHSYKQFAYSLENRMKQGVASRSIIQVINLEKKSKYNGTKYERYEKYY